MRRPDRLPPACRWWWRCRKPRSRCSASCRPAMRSACRWCRAAPAPACRAARCRRATACCCRWRSSCASCASIRWRASRVVQPGVRNLAISEVGGALRPVLRARSLEPDRLLHRRQRRRELRRRALPEVRPHGAQRAARARLHHRGRAGRVRRRGARCAGLRPARADDRLRGHARGDHRSHGQAAAQAARRAQVIMAVVRRRGEGRRRGGRR